MGETPGEPFVLLVIRVSREFVIQKVVTVSP